MTAAAIEAHFGDSDKASGRTTNELRVAALKISARPAPVSNWKSFAIIREIRGIMIRNAT
ncbi:hypothetical protein D3C74_495310 [compost metagenome]